MNKIVHFLITYLLIQTSLLAQIPGVTQFTTNNGLSSNTIYDSVQDENGFMWFATDYGISKFDGLSFKNYTVNDGLPGNEILNFYKDSKGRIWIAAFNGNLGFIKNGKIFNKTNNNVIPKLNFPAYINDIFEDSKGNIWFCQNLRNIKVLNKDGRINRYNLKNPKNKFKVFIVENKKNEVCVLTYEKLNNKVSIVSKKIDSNFELNEWNEFNPNNYLDSSLDKLNENLSFLLRSENNEHQNLSNYFSESNNEFIAKSYKTDKNYWITNINEGILIFYKSDNYCTPKATLKSVRSTRAYIDSEKNIWIGSQSDGVFLFPNQHIHGIQFDDKTKNDLYTVNIFQNKIVLGNEQSEIIVLNKKNLKISNTFKVYPHPKRIRQIKKQGDDLYVLSDYNINKLNPDLSLKNLTYMFKSELYNSDLKNFKDLSISEDFIFTANANGIGKINKKTNTAEKIWDKRSSAILHTKDSLWIGTTSGLYLHNKDTIAKFDLNEHFNNSIIYSLKSFNNRLLIGSNAYGLGILKNNKLTVLSKLNGLLSNYIKSINIDSKNRIWLSTNFGLNCLTINTENKIEEIKSYTISDGLYSNDVRASYVQENMVYVATSKGLNIINLSNEVTSISPPTIHINEVLINNSIIEKTEGQKFDNRNNNVQFNFSGISFKSLGNITFNYRLQGLETDWISTKVNSVRYSALPPNNYTFELKAISKNNLESVPKLFSFTIKPPFYNTWWFIALCLLILITIISYTFYSHNLKLTRKLKTKEQILNLKYKALNAQMNPHFINNLLVNINGLVEKGEINEVKGSLDKFAGLVNLILDATKSNLINLSKEIEMANLYLELQKLRFNHNISFEINTSKLDLDDLDSIYVPPMILQPIIENSFKHGFKQDDKPNNIFVEFNIVNDEYLICEISDNGIGLNNSKEIKSTNSGISFDNINERLQLINDSNQNEDLVIISNIVDDFNTLVGLKVTLKIPLISF